MRVETEVHCVLPAFVEMHVHPDSQVDIKRSFTVFDPSSSPIISEAFLCCSKTHTFGLFVYTSSGKPVHYWNSFYTEWSLPASANGSPIVFFNNSNESVTSQLVTVSKHGCYGAHIVEAKLAINPSLVLRHLEKGPLKTDIKGTFCVISLSVNVVVHHDVNV